VHTTASDGSASAEYIARQAARAGVEAVALTDHNQLSPGAGRHGSVLVMAGEEVTPRHNHLLVLGLEETLPTPGWNMRDIPPIEHHRRARELGGWTVLAHPLDSSLPFLPDSRSFSCLDFSRLDYSGLELWNVLSAYKRGLKGVFSALTRGLFPRTFLAAPHPTVLALWDAVGRRRPWPALGGADAHAFESRRFWLPLKIFSYRRHMGLITTGLWLERPLGGDYASDCRLVLDALARGRCFAALGRARGFECHLIDRRGE
jgi:hypothetical protein